MDLRTNEHSEPSHIHIPRPSHAERRSVQVRSLGPGDFCARLIEDTDDRPFADRD